MLRVRLSHGRAVPAIRWRYAPGGALPLGASFARALEASYVTAGGLLAWLGAGAIRDAHYLGAIRTLLLEPQSTNLVDYSTPAPAQWQWYLGFDQGAVAGPDGVAATARQWHQNTSLPDSAMYRNLALAAGAYRHSSWMRWGTDGATFRRMSQSTASVVAFSPDHALDGTWRRFSDVLTSPAALVNIGWRGYSLGNALSAQCAYYQVEAGAGAATSTIRTNGAALTRPRDVLTFAQTGTVYGKYYDDAGVLQEEAYDYVAGAPFSDAARARAYIAMKMATTSGWSLIDMRNA